MKRTRMLLLSALLAFGALIPLHGPVGATATDDLYAAINAYRTGLGLPAIPLSPQLTAVAKAHVEDLIANFTTDPNYTGAGCIPHGWSSNGQWTGGCYRSDDPSTFPIMWSKPQEISNYPGSGFEILFSSSGEATAAAALQAWQSDAPHNDVIVNQGIWQSHPWQAIGVWVEDGWASVWFGEQADPNATQPANPQTGAAPAPNDNTQTGAAPAPPPAGGAGTTDTTTGNGTTNAGTTNGTTDTTAGNGTTDAGAAQGNTTTGAATTTNANPATAGCGDAEELAFLALINDYRAANGLGPLTMSPTLTAAARGHSQDMATKNYFDHNGLDGSTFSQRIVAAGYPADAATAENIFAGDQTASGAMESWKNSPPHNANMLDPNFTAIGIGRAFDANSEFGWYWTTTFGSTVDAACGTQPTAAQPADNAGATTGQTGTDTQNPQTGANGQTGQTGNTTTGTGANDPAGADTDLDGLLDDAEINIIGTDPNVFDTDGGGVGDGDEWINGKNPLDPSDDNAPATGTDVDTDGDGLTDADEAFFGTNPNAADTDGDGVSDMDELLNGSDPNDPNSF